MPEVELWMLLATVAAAVVPWAFSIHAKVAVIAHSVESLPQIVAELRDCIAEHESRLEEHDKEIQALKVSARAG
jgi:predicted component of type VI protein secretion system